MIVLLMCKIDYVSIPSPAPIRLFSMAQNPTQLQIFQNS